MARHIPRDFNEDVALYLKYDDIINYCNTGITTICDYPTFWIKKVDDILNNEEITAQELMLQSIEHNWKYYIITLLNNYPDDLDYRRLFFSMKKSSLKGKEKYKDRKWIIPLLIETAKNYDFTDQEKNAMLHSLHVIYASINGFNYKITKQFLLEIGGNPTETFKMNLG